MQTRLASAVLAATMTCSLASARQRGFEEAQLLSISPSAGDLMGAAVAIDGDTISVGLPLDDTLGTDFGQVSVFTRNGNTWMRQQDISGTNPHRGAFGTALALQGDLLVVGEPNQQSGPQFVYVYERSGGAWALQAQFTGSQTNSFDRFGESVALDGDVIVVGAKYADYTGPGNEGEAYVFRTTVPGVYSSWTEEAILLPSTPQSSAHFGYSVDVDGDYALVGAYAEDSQAVDSGSVYVYRYDPGNGAWTEESKLVDPNGSAGDLFGLAVVLDGDLALISSHQDDTPAGVDAGSVFLAERDFGFWTIAQQFTAPDAVTGDRFGQALALRNGRCLIGAPARDTGGTNAGAAYLFDLTSGTPQLQDVIGPCDRRAEQFFGAAVALADQGAVVGAPGHDGIFVDSGSAYAYVITDETFEAFGFGDGTGNPCPCGNESVEGTMTGCRNSTGLGAALGALGSDDVLADDLVLRACNLPPSVPALLFAGSARLVGAPFGDGLRVAGGMTRRLGVRQADVRGSALWGPGLISQAGFAVGAVRHFQVWYRDALGGPCGSGFNLSSGVSVTMQ